MERIKTNDPIHIREDWPHFGKIFLPKTLNLTIELVTILVQNPLVERDDGNAKVSGLLEPTSSNIFWVSISKITSV